MENPSSPMALDESWPQLVLQTTWRCIDGFPDSLSEALLCNYLYDPPDSLFESFLVDPWMVATPSPMVSDEGSTLTTWLRAQALFQQVWNKCMLGGSTDSRRSSVDDYDPPDPLSEEFHNDFPYQWDILETLKRSLYHFRCLKLVAFILQCFQALFTISCTFKFEWPDGRRPPCTTMPWNIWPSLMVLWGVCWMFYSPLPDWEWEKLEASLGNGGLAPGLETDCEYSSGYFLLRLF